MRKYIVRVLILINFVLSTFLFLCWSNILSDSQVKKHDEIVHNKDVVIQPQSNDVKLQRIINILENKYPQDPVFGIKEEENLPTIYAVTPTYHRWTQKADLVRLCQTFMHVPNFVWIIIEDSETKSELVKNFLKTCRVKSVQLNALTNTHFKLKETDPNWLLPRGVAQRNEGLKWLRSNLSSNTSGVLYFVDDDNTYSLRIFEEIRFTKTVSVWPVGIVGGLKFEGPICKNGKVIKWYTFWKPDRPFPIDMAGFAVNIQLVLNHPEAEFVNKVSRGYQESHFLNKLVKLEDLEAKASDCTEILVWHTRTEKPKMKQEDRLIKMGKPSNPFMEV